MRKARKCPECGQPIKPGRHKANEYEHAMGCPRDRSKRATLVAIAVDRLERLNARLELANAEARHASKRYS